VLVGDAYYYGNNSVVSGLDGSDVDGLNSSNFGGSDVSGFFGSDGVGVSKISDRCFSCRLKVFRDLPFISE
jgi:hypothetical protein